VKNTLLLLLSTLLALASCTSTSPPDPKPVDPVVVTPPPHPDCNAMKETHAHTPGTAGQKTCTPVDPDLARTKSPFAALKIWGDKTLFWKKDEKLTIRFLDGSKNQRQKAWDRFKHLDDICGISFELTDKAPSDIRVSFAGDGHWSYVGKTCRQIEEPEPTMNIQLVNSDSAEEWDRVALHEMLHALGFNHEQQHPGFEIPWDEEKVIAEYAKTQGWSEEQTRIQVLNRENPRQFFGSGYDSNSIMHYPIPARLTKGGYSVGWNSQMSSCDIVWLQRAYPIQANDVP
jgi:hypothetical protein